MPAPAARAPISQGPLRGIGVAADDERSGDPERWRGQNLLGLALMEARERSRAGTSDQVRGTAAAE
ncbi:hypothetical protein GBW32_26845 [Streptomyces tsukubensis]|uniref:Riboflavin biosynthesis intermediates N-glycosidase n=1 Tax=Streptomyces tsukubensis TaxID=83656 RepID=A0A1V4A555_9ACTN|nr:hypothetical protein B1H18_21045 [Streptomyces tsukubensis]QFR96005.1 hypothetical protein GBW32_26845 [Streptomyces tsukubensis]